MPRSRTHHAGTPTDVETLHLKLIRDVSCFWPDKVAGRLDVLAVKDRAEHIREILDIVAGYVTAVTADTAGHAPGFKINADVVHDMLADAAAVVVAHIGNSIERKQSIRLALATAEMVAAE